MSRHRHLGHETTGPPERDVLHLRVPGAAVTLCGAPVSPAWCAWSREVFDRATRAGCNACHQALPGWAAA